MVTGIDTSVLLGFYQNRAGLTGSGAALASAASKKVAPTAPWNRSLGPQDTSAEVKGALQGRKFINEGGAKLDLPGASTDYRKLFALYSGLSTLMGVAEQSNAKLVSDTDRAKLSRTFDRGLAEINKYIEDLDLEQARVIQGTASTSAKTKLGVPRNKTEYVTPPLVSGSSANEVPAFTGNVQFNIAVKRSGGTVNVPIDLAGMGGQTRSLVNVITYMNQQLEAAGVDARVASQRIAGGPKTTKINGKDVTIGTNPDQFALKFNVATGETLSFSAPATAGAVYVAQDAGNPDPDGKASTKDSTTVSQFLKFQTDTTNVPAPTTRLGDGGNSVDGRVFGQNMGPEVKTVRDTKVAADGSVYMLADVTNKTAGQELKGDQDVALLKYDAAGKLIFARTLGASDEASGLGLAIAADGKIAVAGSVKGGLGGATDGPLNSTDQTLTDSFVTLYDAEGQELWTQRRGARAADEASEVAFGADGTVYVQGRTSSGMPGSSAVGGSDSYIEAFKADAMGKIQPVFTTTYGTAGIDKPAGMVVDGTNLVVASMEDGRGVLRRYDVSGGTPVLTSTRDLGDLQGGTITGLALDGGNIVVAGSTGNPGLNGLSVTRAHAGGSDAFAATMSADLSGGGQVAYYGGAGDDRATSLAVSGGQVWIGGAAGTDLPDGLTNPVGVKDGFLARLDIGAGTVQWSRRFTGKDGRAAPTSIAVDTSGASVLDRIGLPKGEMDLTDSTRLTAQSSLRAGDTFTLKAGYSTRTITIDAAETIDTLATKIRRASGFQAKVTISTVEGMRTMRIEPANDRTLIEFGAGKTDRDALAMLGIPEGVVRKTKVVDGKTLPADGKEMLYGLGLEDALNLDGEIDRNHALAVIGKAMGIVRQVYKDLVAAAQPESVKRAQEAQAKAGQAPAYLSNQIANYQAALARLGG